MQMSGVSTTVALCAVAAVLAACSNSENKSAEAPATETAVAETTATETATATADAAAAAPESAAAPVPAEAVAPASAAGGVTYASLTGDAVAGEKVFIQCKSCHVVEPGVNRVGPSLHGVVGRTAGSVEGFRYSPANKNSGLVWTEEQLFTYLENPRKTVPGTYMAFAGLKEPQKRADVIAYLKTKA